MFGPGILVLISVNRFEMSDCQKGTLLVRVTEIFLGGIKKVFFFYIKSDFWLLVLSVVKLGAHFFCHREKLLNSLDNSNKN